MAGPVVECRRRRLGWPRGGRRAGTARQQSAPRGAMERTSHRNRRRKRVRRCAWRGSRCCRPQACQRYSRGGHRQARAARSSSSRWLRVV
eukprot:2790134-Pleurochrysis_carterae.AAC.1